MFKFCKLFCSVDEKLHVRYASKYDPLSAFNLDNLAFAIIKLNDFLPSCCLNTALFTQVGDGP